MEVSISQLEMPKASAYAALALDILNSDSPDFKKLENAIMHDPVLASTLIRYANSPLNRRAREISNVPAAIQMLGLKSVRSAVVTATIRSLMPAESDTGLAIMNHMVNISMLCKCIARQCCPSVAEDLEFLGLVHDVGMLVLAANYQRSYDKLLTMSIAQQTTLDILEQQEFRVTHDQVTARAAQEFRLPSQHIELLKGFHCRQALQQVTCDQDRDIAILSLAHSILQDIDRDNSSDKSGNNQDTNNNLLIPETQLETTHQLQELLELSDAQIDQIKEQASEHLSGSAL